MRRVAGSGWNWMWTMTALSTGSKPTRMMRMATEPGSILTTTRDGTIDRSETYTFDDDGNRTRRDFDQDDDGTIDWTVHLNADGRWERVELDVDDDGTIDRITHYAFDGDGNRRVTRRGGRSGR